MRISVWKKDEVLSEYEKHPDFGKCCCCNEKSDIGGFFNGGDFLTICSTCAVNKSDMVPFGYSLADSYLDAKMNNRTSLTPLQFVEQTVKNLERIMYYSISHGLNVELDKIKK
jgi:hypothetical protein